MALSSFPDYEMPHDFEVSFCIAVHEVANQDHRIGGCGPKRAVIAV